MLSYLIERSAHRFQMPRHVVDVRPDVNQMITNRLPVATGFQEFFQVFCEGLLRAPQVAQVSAQACQIPVHLLWQAHLFQLDYDTMGYVGSLPRMLYVRLKLFYDLVLSFDYPMLGLSLI